MDFDVVIVGGGAVGASAAYFLRHHPKRCSVALVERDPGFALASTPRASGGVRRLFSLPENIRLSHFGIDFFAKLNKDGVFNKTKVTPATVSSGETPIVLDWDYLNVGNAAALKQQNITWTTADPSDGLVSGYYAQAVSINAAHPAAQTKRPGPRLTEPTCSHPSLTDEQCAPWESNPEPRD